LIYGSKQAGVKQTAQDFSAYGRKEKASTYLVVFSSESNENGIDTNIGEDWVIITSETFPKTTEML
jgi:hypothetical protein